MNEQSARLESAQAEGRAWRGLRYPSVLALLGLVFVLQLLC
ncbi:MAG: hypothetical protein ACI841_003930 [Planctomycetota bacterium]|jgi:hypothetical protein